MLISTTAIIISARATTASIWAKTSGTFPDSISSNDDGDVFNELEISRPKTKRLATVKAVSAEIRAIEGEDISEAALFSQDDQRGIRQVHGPVMIFLH